MNKLNVVILINDVFYKKLISELLEHHFKNLDVIAFDSWYELLKAIV